MKISNMTTKISTKELNKRVYNYMLDCLDSEDRTFKNEVEKWEHLFNRFKSEYGWNIKRIGSQSALIEWYQGLAIGIDYENYRIIEIAKEWGSIPEDATEAQEYKIINNWFNLLAAKTLQIFRRNKLEVN